MQRHPLFFCAVLALALPAAAADASLWYLRTASGQMHPAWFEPGARPLELRVNEAGVVRTSEVQFDDGGFVELRPAAPARRWKLDGLSWRASDGTVLTPAWVIPAGRGPGH